LNAAAVPARFALLDDMEAYVGSMNQRLAPSIRRVCG
jgi:hypothetical protein